MARRVSCKCMVEWMVLSHIERIWIVTRVKLFVGALAFLVVMGAIGVLYARRMGHLATLRQQMREHESWEHGHPPMAPVVYPSQRWKNRYGKEEPDRRTEKGKVALDADMKRLPQALAEFRSLLDGLPLASLGPDASGVDVFLERTARLLDGFVFHEFRGEVLNDVKWMKDGNGRLTPPLDRIVNEVDAGEVLRRFYRVRCTLADMLWIRCGDEYAAAQSDYRCYHMLEECRRVYNRRGWHDAVQTADSLMEKWREERCDKPNSNFHRAHEYCEEMYHACFEARVKRGEVNVLKAWSDHYRFHLGVARSVLKRDPQWAPRED